MDEYYVEFKKGVTRLNTTGSGGTGKRQPKRERPKRRKKASRQFEEPTQPASLIPRGGKYLDHGLNVLLIGLHGTGKTTAVFDAAAEKGLKVKMFTCSTLDVYVDLVGVPETVTDSQGNRTLSMIRPHDVDEADLIFFDEINRANPVTLNAILEIVQFGSINGEKLPKLRCCWAAMNPPDNGYQVEDLDPALVDRFDVYEEIDPKASVKWLSNKMRPEIAEALVNWYQAMHRDKRDSTDYISPRRLEKMGVLYELIGTCDPAIPGWMTVERAKLAAQLRDAEAIANGTSAAASQGGVGAVADPALTYEKAWLSEHHQTVTAKLAASQDDLATHNSVLEALKGCQAPRLVKEFAGILNAIKPSVLEAFIGGLTSGKFDRLVDELSALQYGKRSEWPNLVSVVAASAEARA